MEFPVLHSNVLSEQNDEVMRGAKNMNNSVLFSAFLRNDSHFPGVRVFASTFLPVPLLRLDLVLAFKLYVPNYIDALCTCRQL